MASAGPPVIAPFLQVLLEQAFAEPPSPDSHFTLYGPLNSLIYDIFHYDTKSHYMITPPHKRSGDEDPIELEGGGRLTTACFIVNKFIAHGPEDYEQQTTASIHIKRGDESVPAARARLARYLTRVASEPRVADLKGVLILGNDVEVYSLTDGSPDAKISNNVITFSNPAGPEFRALLFKIAVDNSDD